MRSQSFHSDFSPTRPAAVCGENDLVADGLDELADLLESKGANPFRVRAYHAGADLVRKLDLPVREILGRGGRAALLQLPGIGDSLSIAIARLAATGELPLLKRLRGRAGNEAVLRTVPGIGSKTAALIRQQLGISTLADLEIAAHDGRLAKVPGLGSKRLRAVQDSLAGRLGHRRGTSTQSHSSRNESRPLGSQQSQTGQSSSSPPERRQMRLLPFPSRPQTPSSRLPSSTPVSAASTNEPLVAELLSIDAEFRQKEKAGRLPRIAPLRFNPEGEAWLPILHTNRDDRKYTALYSNSPLANEQHTTHDWVIIRRDGHGVSGQWTVVTERSGALEGRRVVRGRESECQEHYAAEANQQPSLF